MIVRRIVTNSESWGVLHVKPLKERSVVRHLAERGLTGYLPLYRRRPLRRGRPPVLGPMFPSYVFVDLAPRDAALTAMWTPGVLRLLQAEGRPQLVPRDLVEALRASERGKGYVVLRRTFAPQTRLRIKSGLLAGFEGVFHNDVSDGERVRILLSHLGYQALVEVSVEDVEEAPGKAPTPRRKRTA